MKTNTKKQILGRVLVLAKRGYSKKQGIKKRRAFEKCNPLLDAE